MINLNKKYLCTLNGKDFTIRAINTSEEMLENPQAINALDRLMIECEQDTGKFEGQLKHAHTKEELEKVIKFDEAWARRTFTGHQTVFLVESEDELACTILVTINDPVKREALKVPAEIGTFVYVGDVITEENFKRQGVFATAFDKITTILANPKRGFEQPIAYSISMSNAEINRGNKWLTYPMNLNRYSQMWQDRFDQNRIQVRIQHDSGQQEGTDRLPLMNVETLSDALESYKNPGEGKRLRGVYLEGVAGQYDEMKAKRLDLRERRPNTTFKLKSSQKEVRNERII